MSRFCVWISTIRIGHHVFGVKYYTFMLLILPIVVLELLLKCFGALALYIGAAREHVWEEYIRPIGRKHERKAFSAHRIAYRIELAAKEGKPSV